MEAKDTVMNHAQLESVIRKDYEDFQIEDETGYIQDILFWSIEAQAEISFKAGYTQGISDVLKDNYEKLKEWGI